MDAHPRVVVRAKTQAVFDHGSANTERGPPAVVPGDVRLGDICQRRLDLARGPARATVSRRLCTIVGYTRPRSRPWSRPWVSAANSATGSAAPDCDLRHTVTAALRLSAASPGDPTTP